MRLQIAELALKANVRQEERKLEELNKVKASLLAPDSANKHGNSIPFRGTSSAQKKEETSSKLLQEQRFEQNAVSSSLQENGDFDHSERLENSPMKCGILAVIIFNYGVLGIDVTNDTANDPQDFHIDEIGEQVYRSSTITDTTPESIGTPQSTEHKPHHHEKHKNPFEGAQSHTRSPVYEVAKKPCYSPGCGVIRFQDIYSGYRWTPGRRRYGNSGPRYYRIIYYKPSRSYDESVPSPPGYASGYGYGLPYLDYGYGSRGGIHAFHPERFDRVGGYGRPYDEYFLG